MGGHGKRVLAIDVPLTYAPEPIDGVEIAFQDLTEIKTLEGELKRADRLAAVGRLASGLAHEIRNPLGAIKGAADDVELGNLTTMLDNFDDALARAQAETSGESGDRQAEGAGGGAEGGMARVLLLAAAGQDGRGDAGGAVAEVQKLGAKRHHHRLACE